MKTTHEKLLISLLALGLTSSAGLYAQTAGTLIPFGGAINNANPGLIVSSLLQEDLDFDGNFDIGEDANSDAVFNNGGILPGEGPLLSEFADQVDYDGDGTIDATAAIANANLFNEDLDGDNFFDQTEDLDGDNRLDNVNEDRNNDGLLNNGGSGPIVNGVNTLLAGEGALLNEVVDNVDYNGDGTIAGFFNEDLDLDANLDFGLEDIDGDGVLDATNEDFNGNATFQRHEDLDGDGNFDNVNEDLNNDGILNDGNLGNNLINEDADLDGVLDPGEDLNGDGILNNGGTGPIVNGAATLLAGEGALINEDLDGDGRLDFGTEDANGNGVFDNTLDRTLMEAVNPVTGNRQDLDILVANDVFINGEEVATETYVDAQDAILQAQINTNVADIATNARGIANNRKDIDTNTRGIAMVAALQTTTVLPGMTQALDLSAAHFEGETGLAINYSRRINDNVQINFGAATTSDGDENVVKAGIGWQW
jgi:hypothetical protein